MSSTSSKQTTSSYCTSSFCSSSSQSIRVSCQTQDYSLSDSHKKNAGTKEKAGLQDLTENLFSTLDKGSFLDPQKLTEGVGRLQRYKLTSLELCEEKTSETEIISQMSSMKMERGSLNIRETKSFCSISGTSCPNLQRKKQT